MDAQDDSLLSHLEALRTLLIKCLSALAIGVVPLFFAAPYGLDLLIHFIIGKNEVTLNYFSPSFYSADKNCAGAGFAGVLSLYRAAGLAVFAPRPL